MKTFNEFISEAAEKHPLTTDAQRSEQTDHKAFVAKIPHIDGEISHEHSHTYHTLRSDAYAKQDHIPAIHDHLKKQGFEHSVVNGNDVFKNGDREVKITPSRDDSEIVIHSKLSSNAPGKSRPGATKSARVDKQNAWNARYD